MLYAHASRILHHRPTRAAPRHSRRPMAIAKNLGSTACLPARNRRDGRGVRPAMPAGATAYGNEEDRPTPWSRPQSASCAAASAAARTTHPRRARGHHPEPLRRESILKEIEDPRQGARLYRRNLGSRQPRQHVPLQGAPKANMYNHLPHMDTDHSPTINLYRKPSRSISPPGCVTTSRGGRSALHQGAGQYHIGGYLKIAPEHTEEAALKMMKPGMGSYYGFGSCSTNLKGRANAVPDPLLRLRPPGRFSDEDMVNMALWIRIRPLPKPDPRIAKPAHPRRSPTPPPCNYRKTRSTR